MNDLINIFSNSDPTNVSTSVKLLLLLTVLSLAPSILILMTSFARIVIVLSFVRTALAIVLMDQAALIISAKNATVITAMDRTEAKQQLFTNIDGTIVL